MEIEVTDKAIDLATRKGGKVSVDFIKAVG